MDLKYLSIKIVGRTYCLNKKWNTAFAKNSAFHYNENMIIIFIYYIKI